MITVTVAIRLYEINEKHNKRNKRNNAEFDKQPQRCMVYPRWREEHLGGRVVTGALSSQRTLAYFQQHRRV
ncbi:hypothetical protein GCM10007171_31410 [Dickeya fangzhongdai]|nr:hypothetical protein GCM10007171_31410 [Dickeya fangzhongdai]